jgi:hypothetical protein
LETPLPAEKALELFRRLGDQVWAFGISDIGEARLRSHIEIHGGVDHWRVYTAEGLAELSAVLREHFKTD